MQRLLEEAATDAHGRREPESDSPYSCISWIEISLHEILREALAQEYGQVEEEWWRQGVPLDIRKSCASRREEDSDPKHAYHYLDIVDLRAIIDRNWGIFSPYFQNARTGLAGKGDWLAALLRLNEVRRKVMHPLRGDVVTDDEMTSLTSLREAINTVRSAVDAELDRD